MLTPYRSFRVVTRIYTKWFDLPLYSLVPFVTERLLLETDFINEADNAERMAKLVAGEPRLRGRVYVPKVYRELSSKRVMTAEWIEGVRLWDKENLTKPWKGKWRQGSPGCGGAPLDPPKREEVVQIVNDRSLLCANVPLGLGPLRPPSRQHLHPASPLRKARTRTH